MGDVHRGSSDALEGAGDIVLDRFRGRDLKFIIAVSETWSRSVGSPDVDVSTVARL